MRAIEFIDSHTEGEPTRVVVEGGPPLIGKTMAEKREDFRYRFDHFRTAIVCEPRGSEILVGALLKGAGAANCEAGVIFFNNAGYLGMCGHGLIGVLETLRHLGRVDVGTCRVDTPAGAVGGTLHDDGSISVANVASYRYKKDFVVKVNGYGEVKGDIAFGGNWFFLIKDERPLNADRAGELMRFTSEVMDALAKQRITGKDGMPIDHIEICGPSTRASAKNFVLCPGKQYDRSPCGTGTSAAMACLFEDGLLREGETWVQESFTGTKFEGKVERKGSKLIPTIRGRAYINAIGKILLDDDDPLIWGVR